MLQYIYRVWCPCLQPPHEFMKMMRKSIEKQSRELYVRISTIENAIKDCANILTIKKVTQSYSLLSNWPSTSSHDCILIQAPYFTSLENVGECDNIKTMQCRKVDSSICGLHGLIISFCLLLLLLCQVVQYPHYLTLQVLNFWKFTSYCSLKPLWSGIGEVVPARTSPTLHPPSLPTVHQLLRLAL